MVSVTRRRRNHSQPHTLLILRLIAALRSERKVNADLRDEITAMLADRAILLNELGERDDLIEQLEGALGCAGVPL